MANLKELVTAKMDKIPNDDRVWEEINRILERRDVLDKAVQSLKMPPPREVIVGPRKGANLNRIDLNQFSDETSGNEKSARQLVRELLDEVASLEQEYDQLMSE